MLFFNHLSRTSCRLLLASAILIHQLCNASSAGRKTILETFCGQSRETITKYLDNKRISKSDMVVLHGLKEEQECYNNKTARVVNIQEDGKCRVKLIDNYGLVNPVNPEMVSEENLRPFKKLRIFSNIERWYKEDKEKQDAQFGNVIESDVEIGDISLENLKDGLYVGARVVIMGIQTENRKVLNGVHARILEWSGESKRYTIELVDISKAFLCFSKMYPVNDGDAMRIEEDPHIEDTIFNLDKDPLDVSASTKRRRLYPGDYFESTKYQQRPTEEDNLLTLAEYQGLRFGGRPYNYKLLLQEYENKRLSLKAANLLPLQSWFYNHKNDLAKRGNYWVQLISWISDHMESEERAKNVSTTLKSFIPELFILASAQTQEEVDSAILWYMEQVEKQPLEPEKANLLQTKIKKLKDRFRRENKVPDDEVVEVPKPQLEPENC